MPRVVPMNIIGFTGTRKGMNKFQMLEVAKRFGWGTHFHHGDCIGADAEAALLAHDMGLIVICHPPVKTRHRAYAKAHHTREPKDYLARNRAIVDSCDMLIATPAGEEKLRSGTWSTIRYARRWGRHIYIVYPDSVQEITNE